jgi:hypothetical protein
LGGTALGPQHSAAFCNQSELTAPGSSFFLALCQPLRGDSRCKGSHSTPVWPPLPPTLMATLQVGPACFSHASHTRLNVAPYVGLRRASLARHGSCSSTLRCGPLRAGRGSKLQVRICCWSTGLPAQLKNPCMRFEGNHVCGRFSETTPTYNCLEKCSRPQTKLMSMSCLPITAAGCRRRRRLCRSAGLSLLTLRTPGRRW